MSGKVEIFLNRGHGAFGFSIDFCIFLKSRINDLYDFEDLSESDIENDFEDYDDVIIRTASSIIKLMREFGIEQCAARHCQFIIISIDKTVIPFISIHNYRNFESIDFQFEAYWNSICTKDTTNDQIVEKMNTFFAIKKATLDSIKQIKKNDN